MLSTTTNTARIAGAPITVCTRSGGVAAGRPSYVDEGDTCADSRSFVKSVARGMTVIHAFANASRPLSIAEVSHRIDVPRAAVRRMLHTLCELGYVRALGLRFELTAKTLQLGHAFASSNPVAGSVQPVVGRLAEELGTFCAMAVPEDDQVMLMCLAGTAKPSASRSLYSGVGSRLPHYASASGHLFLGAMSGLQLEAYLERAHLQPLTHHTPTLPQRIREQVHRARERGYAVCDRTFAGDVSSIAVPVLDLQGRIRASFVAVVRAHRLEDLDLRSALVPALKRAAQEASQCWRRAEQSAFRDTRVTALTA